MAAIFLRDEGITFSDVLLVPQFSKIESRSMVDLSVYLDCGDNKKFKFETPVIAANMKTIMSKKLALESVIAGCLTLLHRFCTLQDQIDIIDFLDDKETSKNIFDYLGVSVGVKKIDKQNLDVFIARGIKIVCIDIAHCDSILGIEMCKYISTKYPNVLLIAGNVATAGGANRLWDAGADVIKAGIGPGSLCSTRLEAGAGVPQLTAIMNIWNERQQYGLNNKYIISDGGVIHNCDFGKALCFSHLVMSGNKFAGSSSCPGEIIEIKDGKKYKKYVGSSTHKSKNVEGVEALVTIKPAYPVILDKIIGAIQSCCSYQGVKNLEELKENPVFMRVSSASWHESKPHNIEIIEIIEK